MITVVSTLPMPPITDEWLERMRDSIFKNADCVIYLHLGYFQSWFSAVELAITAMMANLAGFGDLENFEILASGLQPRQKVERLKRLAKKRGCTFGPNLTHFLDELTEVIDLRNDLAHCRLSQTKRPDVFAIRTLSKAEGKGARIIKGLELFRFGLWLHNFAADLIDVLGDLKSRPKILEIELPRNPVGKATNPTPAQPKPPATAGRRARKRARKGLAPCGKRPA